MRRVERNVEGLVFNFSMYYDMKLIGQGKLNSVLWIHRYQNTFRSVVFSKKPATSPFRDAHAPIQTRVRFGVYFSQFDRTVWILEKVLSLHR